jgi:hypothetical protein
VAPAPPPPPPPPAACYGSISYESGDCNAVYGGGWHGYTSRQKTVACDGYTVTYTAWSMMYCTYSF